MISISEFRW